MVQGGEHLGFALKPREPIVVSGDCRRQNLDRNLAFQPRVRRAKHLPHAAFANLRGDFVTPTVTGGEGAKWVDYMGIAEVVRTRLFNVAPGLHSLVSLRFGSRTETADFGMSAAR